jgi:hypothetical protein
MARTTITPGTERDVYQALSETGINAASARTLAGRARATGSYTHHAGTSAYLITWDAEAGYQVKRSSTDKDRSWTIAFRTPRANRFRRVTDWSGSCEQAREMAGAATSGSPQLEVWFVPTLAAEESGYSCEEDRGNILAVTGRRVRMVDNAVLADVVTPEVMDARKAGQLVTQVTEAVDEAAALVACAAVPRRVLLAAADLLYIDSLGRASATLRRAIVAEARA